MHIRVIKGDDCDVCKIYLPKLKEWGFEYETLNADDPELQTELDLWRIDDLPVLQVVDGSIVKYQFPPGKHSRRALTFALERFK